VKREHEYLHRLKAPISLGGLEPGRLDIAADLFHRCAATAVRRFVRRRHSIDIVSIDQTGIVAGLSGFFASRNIDICEVATRGYAAAHTGAPMFAVQMVVHIPAKIHIAALREEFMDLCDQLNLDAILEPVKA